MIKTAIQSLSQRVLALIARGVLPPTTDAEFGELAREIFTFQFDHNATYRAYCTQLKQSPRRLTDWRQIPAVPTSAFKEFPIVCFPKADAVAEFHTSGTTRAKPGRHYFPTLELYDAALKPNFAAHLFPDGAQLPLLSLVSDSAHSSLAHMIRTLGAKFVKQLPVVNAPVCILGTAFHFINLFDAGFRCELPPGSRAMETGGFKGRSREVAKPELYRLFEQHLGLPAAHVVNEYGMTELSTQFYDLSLRLGRQTDRKMPPPWSRVLIIDPNTGREAALGERGLIRVFDLANVGSAMCIQTEDLGVVHPDGTFEVLGRSIGAEPRGCSLTAL